MTTDVWRKGIVTTYSVGWVRRETEHLNEIPSELANELDPRLKIHAWLAPRRARWL